MKQQIVADTEVIVALGRKLYKNRHEFILVRELVQNAIDASNSDDRILVDVNWDNHNKTFEVTVDDIGHGMSYDTLVNVFLAIGGTKKQGNSVGGFGIAKLALFMADEWFVHSHEHYIDNTLEYRQIDYRVGTVVYAKIFIDDIYYRYQESVDRLMFSNDASNIVYNGDKLLPYNDYTKRENRIAENGLDYTFSLANELPVSEFSPWEKVESGYAVYRINGLTQFIEYRSNDLQKNKRNIVVDFNDIGYNAMHENYPFSLSRETLTNSDISKYINDWLESLAKDTQSKIRQQEENSNLKTEWINQHTGLINRGVNGKLYKPNTRERRVVALWKEMVLTLAPEIDWKFAVTNDPNKDAFYQNKYGEIIIGINAIHFLENMSWEIAENKSNAILLSIFHLAVHEITHYQVSGHDEQFAAKENDIATNNAWRVEKNIAQLRARIRKLFD